MLFANRCTWAHAVAAAARVAEWPPETLLTAAEADAVAGRRGPQTLLHPDED